MGDMNVLKRLSYQPSLIRLARRLGARNALRALYHRWARPAGGTLRVKVGEVEADFFVETAEELRLFEKAQGGYWEKDTLDRLMDILAPGDVVYDIGANVGLYTVLLAKKVGKDGEVIAFEPHSRTYRRLVSNMKLNELANVRAFRKALGERDAEGKLFFDQDLLFSNLIRPRTQPNFEIVDITEGDRLVARENLPIPRVVKIDVEGYEHAVLRGLRRTLENRGCQLVCCEVHPALLPAEVNVEEMVSLLRSFGFDRIDRHPAGEELHLAAYKPRLTLPAAELRRESK